MDISAWPAKERKACASTCRNAYTYQSKTYRSNSFSSSNRSRNCCFPCRRMSAMSSSSASLALWGLVLDGVGTVRWVWFERESLVGKVRRESGGMAGGWLARSSHTPHRCLSIHQQPPTQRNATHRFSAASCSRSTRASWLWPLSDACKRARSSSFSWAVADSSRSTVRREASLWGGCFVLCGWRVGWMLRRVGRGLEHAFIPARPHKIKVYYTILHNPRTAPPAPRAPPPARAGPTPCVPSTPRWRRPRPPLLCCHRIHF